MKTEESNSLIAEFMGIVFYDDENQWYDSNEGIFLGSTLEYKTSWDWLMPVVGKIEELKGNAIDIEVGCSCTIFYLDKIIAQGYGSTRHATYKAVVQFIQWYNSQPK